MRRYLTAPLMALLVCPSLLAQDAPDNKLRARLDRATDRITDDTYQLRYKFATGDELLYEVEHLVTVKTTIEGVAQNTQSASISGKRWSVTQVDSQGLATFTHGLDYVKMWSETQGRQPVRYDSRTDKSPPPDYEQVAETIGKPLATIVANSDGTIVDRQDSIKQADFGAGGLLVPLPATPIKVGTSWAVPGTVPVRQEDQAYKVIKIRRLYRLEKVETGVATISLKTQVLTPSITPKIRSQLIQRLSNGEIRFDIDAGRVLSKQLDWDESVVDFDGPSSRMAYLGRLKEKLIPPDEVARRPTSGKQTE